MRRGRDGAQRDEQAAWDVAKLAAIFILLPHVYERNISAPQLLERVGIPRLPGDIVIRRGNWTIYIPIATSILLSLILTLLFALFRR